LLPVTAVRIRHSNAGAIFSVHQQKKSAMETQILVNAFAQQCRTFLEEGKILQADFKINDDDWNKMYEQYNTAVRTHVTDVLNRYMRRVIRSHSGKGPELRQTLQSVITQCVEKDLNRYLPA
jgi:hypothetical protein